MGEFYMKENTIEDRKPRRSVDSETSRVRKKRIDREDDSDRRTRRNKETSKKPLRKNSDEKPKKRIRKPLGENHLREKHSSKKRSIDKHIDSEYLLDMRRIVREFDIGGEKVRILKEVDLQVKKGEFLAILGPSGSGKSTLMNIIGLLDVPTSGEYYLNGNLIGKLNEAQLAHIRNKEIGFIFQQYLLLMKNTAMENVMIPMQYAGVDPKKQRKRAEELLTKVGMGERLNFRPNQLSGGLQQRVAIARALANNPAILLADEPTGALDQKTGKQIIELFKELNAEGCTIIMITHDADIARNATRMVKILDGNISEGVAEDA